MSSDRRKLVEQLKRARDTLEDVRAYFFHTRHGREWLGSGGKEGELIDDQLEEIKRVLREFEE